MRHALSIATASLALTALAGIHVPSAAAGDDARSGRIMLAQNSNQNSNSTNTFSLLQSVQRLQDQVRKLRGEIDTLKYQQRQNEQGQRDLYENLDKRLSALENSGAGSQQGGDGARGAVGDSAGQRADGYGSNDANGDYRPDNGNSQKTPSGYGSPEPSAQSSGGGSRDNGGSTNSGGYGAPDRASQRGDDNAQIQSQYMDAFNKLKNGKYDAAVAGFKQFLERYPESTYSDNAWYWLGEANYVQQNYAKSLKAFQTVVNRFNTSSKVPGSLYKIGVIRAEQGSTDNAKATLQRLVAQFPDDKAADMARKRLQSM